MAKEIYWTYYKRALFAITYRTSHHTPDQSFQLVNVLVHHMKWLFSRSTFAAGILQLRPVILDELYFRSDVLLALCSGTRLCINVKV